MLLLQATLTSTVAQKFLIRRQYFELWLSRAAESKFSWTARRPVSSSSSVADYCRLQCEGSSHHVSRCLDKSHIRTSPIILCSTLISLCLEFCCRINCSFARQLMVSYRLLLKCAAADCYRCETSSQLAVIIVGPYIRHWFSTDRTTCKLLVASYRLLITWPT